MNVKLSKWLSTKSPTYDDTAIKIHILVHLLLNYLSYLFIIIITDVITISSSTPVGTILFAVNSTDHENDQLTHSLNYCIKCPFTISQCMYTAHNIFKFGKS